MYDRARDLALFHVHVEQHPGLALRIRRPGFAGERAVRKAWPVLTDPAAELDAQEPALAVAATAFARALVSWTLKFDGVRVPCTPSAVLELDTAFLLELVTVWMEQVVLRSPELDSAEDDTEPDQPGEPELDEEWLAQLHTITQPEVVTADE